MTDAVVESSGRAYYQAPPQYADLLRQVGLVDALSVFEHPQIRVWRSLPDRENCTLDAVLSDGRSVRLHIKRYRAGGFLRNSAQKESAGLKALADANIPHPPLVASGTLPDGRSFVILEDLAGYEPSDKLLENGFPFARLLEPTADLAARLHNAGLHHRDLYLNHFLAREDEHGAIDLRLIDAARVRALPRLTRNRWIIKDLAQFWYSTLQQPVTEPQRLQWMQRYAAQRRLNGVDRMIGAIRRKVRWMHWHHQRLVRKQPNRNIPLPRD